MYQYLKIKIERSWNKLAMGPMMGVILKNVERHLENLHIDKFISVNCKRPDFTLAGH